MIFREPMVEYVQLMQTDISTISGASYRLCQYTGYTTVVCEELQSDVTHATLCGRSPCATSSDATSQQDWNNLYGCDDWLEEGPSYDSV